MSLVLIVLGCFLTAVGVMFGWANKAGESAGGSGLKSIAIEGPAWLVLIVVGCAATFLGVMRWEDRPPKTPVSEQTVPITEPTVPEWNDLTFFPGGFTFGDNNQLDRLWRACDRGEWDKCDELYLGSDEGSDYEWFGATCGGLVAEPVDWCSSDA